MYYRKVAYMADTKELKVKSFRIDDETADRFKELSAQIGGNQQETLAKLIEAYEFQAGKAILTDKKSDIDQFEKYITALTRMYMGSLEDNQNVTMTVRTEFDALLKSKDATIQNLQGQMAVAKQLKEEATAKAKALTDDNDRLHKEVDELNQRNCNNLEEMQRKIDDKQQLVEALQATNSKSEEKLQSLDDEIKSLKEEHERFAVITAELVKLKDIHAQTEREKDDLQKKLDQKSKQHEKAVAELQQHSADALERVREQAQLNLDKSLLELEKKYQKQIEQLNVQKQAEIDKYQQKYLVLLEELKNQQKAGPQE